MDCIPPMGARRQRQGRVIGFVLIGMLAPLCPAVADVQRLDACTNGNAGPYYTVQILSVPAAGRSRVLEIYEALKAKGHLVYCRNAYVHERIYVRLRAGAFKDRQEAHAYAETLREQEGFDGFVAQANLSVESFGQAFDIVATPNDIWFQSDTSLRLLYHFGAAEAAATRTAVRICPAGRDIVFSHDNKILKVNVQTAAVTVLKQGQGEEALFESLLAFSPDGRHIAYLDKAGWELPTSLWVMRSDGSEDRRLVGDATGRTRVKGLQWHPHKDELFYVSGLTYGTVSVGGSLYRVDLGGRKELLVSACTTERTEVCSDFHIADGQVHYRLAHFDADYQVKAYTAHQIPIARQPQQDAAKDGNSQ